MSDSELQVVVVEDHLALRKGVELLLRREGLRVTGVADSADEAKRMIVARRPDVAVVDLGLGQGDGMEVAREVVAQWPDAAMLLYTGGSVSDTVVRDALDSGARGIALKSGTPRELIQAIRAVAAGKEYVDPRLANLLPEAAESSVSRLSPRESEVLDLMADGLKTEEIAQRLVLSPQTVETHVRNLKRKLGARTRVHALAIALKHRQTAT